MNNKKIRPFVLGAIMTDEWAASPNMGEGETLGGNKISTLKKIQTAEGTRTIISGQSVGSWHRQALYDRCGWPVSRLQEVISGRDTRQFYSQCQPITFAEDDGRGYLAAVSVKDGSKNISMTTKRTSPFMMSQFQSVAPVRIEREFGILARGLNETVEENRGSLIFTTEIAAAAYAGMFALNCSELGVFGVGIGRDLLPFEQFNNKLPSNYIKAVLSDAPKDDEKALADDVRRALKRCVDKPRDTNLALAAPERKQRAHDLISALAELEGGAMQTRRLYNVTPAAAFVAFMDGGNCLPPHIFRAVPKNPGIPSNRAMIYEIDVERVYRIICDNAERFIDMGEAEVKTEDGVTKVKSPNVFFGCLGEPTISKTSEVELIAILEGRDENRPLPKQVKAKICSGARTAIHAAADALPESWFECPENAELIGEQMLFGESLQSKLTPKQEPSEKKPVKNATKAVEANPALFSDTNGGEDGNADPS
jgi:CRISPR-associated protein Cas7/Cst2/DevR subtype I-B